VYAQLGERAATVLSARHAVIVDAVFADEGQRRAIEEVAAAAGAAFVPVWLDAPADLLAMRAVHEQVAAKFRRQPRKSPR
jgi:hypothetical protein